MTNQAIICTDGTGLGNPGLGGYAAIVTVAGEEQIIVGRDKTTTSNNMEMTAAIKGSKLYLSYSPSSSTVTAST